MGKPAALDSPDYAETLAAVAWLAVPGHADWCFVELLTADGRIERVVIEHADPSKREFIEEYDRRYTLDPDSPVGSPKVIRTGEPESRSDIPDAFWEAVAQDPEQYRLMQEVGIGSALVVPMRVRGTVIGDLAQHLRPPLHRDGPPARAGPGRPLRGGDRRRGPAHRGPAVARRPRGDRRWRGRRRHRTNA